jgi:hypothetical protein
MNSNSRRDGWPPLSSPEAPSLEAEVIYAVVSLVPVYEPLDVQVLHLLIAETMRSQLPVILNKPLSHFGSKNAR